MLGNSIPFFEYFSSIFNSDFLSKEYLVLITLIINIFFIFYWDYLLKKEYGVLKQMKTKRNTILLSAFLLFLFSNLIQESIGLKNLSFSFILFLLIDFYVLGKVKLEKYLKRYIYLFSIHFFAIIGLQILMALFIFTRELIETNYSFKNSINDFFIELPTVFACLIFYLPSIIIVPLLVIFLPFNKKQKGSTDILDDTSFFEK